MASTPAIWAGFFSQAQRSVYLARQVPEHTNFDIEGQTREVLETVVETRVRVDFPKPGPKPGSE